jgi:hypothetical protein
LGESCDANQLFLELFQVSQQVFHDFPLIYPSIPSNPPSILP